MIKKYNQFLNESNNESIDKIDFILKNTSVIKNFAPNFKEYSTEELYKLNDETLQKIYNSILDLLNKHKIEKITETYNDILRRGIFIDYSDKIAGCISNIDSKFVWIENILTPVKDNTLVKIPLNEFIKKYKN